MINPFPTNVYGGPEYFCDREREAADLISHVNNQSNSAFFAQRRIGKTALIQHVLHLMRAKKTTCIYMDIFTSQNLNDFTNQLATAIYRVFPHDKGIGKKFWNAIRLLRPSLGIDEMTGLPQIALDITKARQFETTVPQLLNFLDKQNETCVLAIDEFQQILAYPEKNVEALLRTAIGSLKNVQFIFCGSNRAMMHQIFNSAKRPFYASTKSITLKKIDREVYTRFIKKQFQRSHRKILPAAIGLILDLSCDHTFYTQQLCHDVFALDIITINTEHVEEALSKILMQHESTFFQYRSLVTPAQWNLLKAIAMEETVTQPYSQDFIFRHQLGSGAKVKRGIEAMLQKELIYYTNMVDQPYYEVQDKFLMRWLQRI